MAAGSTGAEASGHGTPALVEGDWRRRFPFYYGWVIAVACGVTLGLTYTVWYSFSVFYVTLLESFEWSRASSAGVFSVFVLAVGVAGAGAGALADRYGPGNIGAAGAVILALGLVACSRMTDLWQFYLFFGVLCATGLAMAGWIPAVTMVSRWFSASYGQAIGISSAGIGVGIMVMVPVTQMLISAVGWRTAYLVLAGIVLAVVTPTSALVLRGRPEEIGLTRDGRTPAVEAQPKTVGAAPQPSRVVDRAWVAQAWTVSSALRTPRYWFLFVMLGMGNIAAQMIMVHQVAFLVDGGYDKLTAASIAGLVGLFSIFAKIGWGWISDRVGREVTWTLGFTALVIGIGFLVATRIAPFPLVVYFYALAFAMGYAVAPPIGPAAASDVFAGRWFGSIYGTLGIGNGLGSAGGAWTAGYLFDLTGSYFLAFGVAGVASILSVASMWIAAPRRVRLVPGRLRGRSSSGLRV